jgi:translation initiation factor 1 (eIF-1/SUI1)
LYRPHTQIFVLDILPSQQRKEGEKKNLPHGMGLSTFSFVKVAARNSEKSVTVRNSEKKFSKVKATVGNYEKRSASPKSLSEILKSQCPSTFTTSRHYR